ncbi:hypothetical protein [Nonomuraea bangladeshensis]|uniref:hypothetical protein n=1 Tax=Nonomuraea bangladeshensis TaxID=404385 RepID=UPI003C2E3C2B
MAKEAEHQRILLGNDVLTELTARHQFLEADLEEARKTTFIAEQQVGRIEQERIPLAVAADLILALGPPAGRAGRQAGSGK